MMGDVGDEGEGLDTEQNGGPETVVVRRHCRCRRVRRGGLGFAHVWACCSGYLFVAAVHQDV